MLSASLSENTRAVYNNAMNNFNIFRQQYVLPNSWPVPVSHVASYTSYCFHQGYSPASVSTYLSALSYVHKLQQLPDPTQSFIIKKILEGFRRLRARPDIRAPITHDILVKICRVLQFVCYSNYEVVLFRAAFSLAYFGLLRVGEMVYTDQRQADHALRQNDVCFIKNTLRIRVRMSKTNQSGTPVFLHIPPIGDKSICPVQSMLNYINLRPSCDGILFCHVNGHPLTRYQFGAVLSKSVSHLGLPLSCYRSHSFRIGRATSLAMAGVPSDQIKQTGRWKSNVYSSYIRCANS